MTQSSKILPGEYLLAETPAEIEINADREAATVLVQNTGDRPVQVGSHFHFYETNSALHFDRRAAWGRRLDIPAGTAMRFEPGEEKEAPLVALAGARIVHGHNAKVNGPLADAAPGRRELPA